MNKENVNMVLVDRELLKQMISIVESGDPVTNPGSLPKRLREAAYGPVISNESSIIHTEELKRLRRLDRKPVSSAPAEGKSPEKTKVTVSWDRYGDKSDEVVITIGDTKISVPHAELVLDSRVDRSVYGIQPEERTGYIHTAPTADSEYNSAITHKSEPPKEDPKLSPEPELEHTAAGWYWNGTPKDAPLLYRDTARGIVFGFYNSDGTDFSGPFPDQKIDYIPSGCTPADPNVVKEYLFAEAMRRGYKAGNFKCLNGSTKHFNNEWHANIPFTSEDFYLIDESQFWAKKGVFGNMFYCLMKDGVWADILPEKEEVPGPKVKVGYGVIFCKDCEAESDWDKNRCCIKCGGHRTLSLFTEGDPAPAEGDEKMRPAPVPGEWWDQNYNLYRRSSPNGAFEPVKTAGADKQPWELLKEPEWEYLVRNKQILTPAGKYIITKIGDWYSLFFSHVYDGTCIGHGEPSGDMNTIVKRAKAHYAENIKKLFVGQ